MRFPILGETKTKRTNKSDVISRYYAISAFDWQPFNELVTDATASAHARLAAGLIATGMVKAAVLAKCPDYEQVLRDSLPQLLMADEWYDGATQEDILSRGKVIDAIFNPRDPLWCYPTRGEFAVLREIVQIIMGTIEIDRDDATAEGWSHRVIPQAAPRTRELQWFANRPFRCRDWSGTEQEQREFERRWQRKPYSIHSPEQVALLQADLASAAEACRQLPFEELRGEYESLATQICKAAELGQAIYAKQAAPEDIRTKLPDYMIERMLEEVGIHVGPPKKKFYANPFFNELQCGDAKKLGFTAKLLEQEFPTLGDDCESLGPQGNPAFCYRLCVDKCVWMLYDWHFGFRGVVRPPDVVTKGVELSLNYFRVVGERLAAKSGDLTMDAAWFEPYSAALLLTTLSGDTSRRTLLSDYLHPTLTVEKTTVSRADAALGDLLLSIAASFQSSPMDTVPLLKRLRKSRRARPKLLFEAWQALESGDRAKFIAALAASTSTFAKTAADDRPRAAIALPESILAALAHERGWTDLDLASPVAARLVTQASLTWEVEDAV